MSALSGVALDVESDVVWRIGRRYLFQRPHPRLLGGPQIQASLRTVPTSREGVIAVSYGDERLWVSHDMLDGVITATGNINDALQVRLHYNDYRIEAVVSPCHSNL